MSLLDDLRAASTAIDPQFVPSSNETGRLLAALIAFNDHGAKFLKAAEGDNASAKVTDLLAGSDDGAKKSEGKG